MYYAKKVNDEYVRCNFSDMIPAGTLSADASEEQLAEHGLYVIHDALSIPEHNSETHGLVETIPTVGPDGKLHANYIVIEKAPEPEVPELPQP
jgi:hypothetical protein